MGDTFLFSLGGTFLIIFHQYLYGWNFLILSWVAFSYGWHFHGAHFDYVLILYPNLISERREIVNACNWWRRGYICINSITRTLLGAYFRSKWCCLEKYSLLCWMEYLCHYIMPINRALITIYMIVKMNVLTTKEIEFTCLQSNCNNT